MIKKEVLNHIPKPSISLVENLINEDNLKIKIVKIRKTKHGDFKILKDGSSQITLNNINNKYRFLITLIHELAHFRVIKNSKIRVKPQKNLSANDVAFFKQHDFSRLNTFKFS